MTTTTRAMKKAGIYLIELQGDSKMKNVKDVNKKEKVNAVVSEEIGLKMRQTF